MAVPKWVTDRQQKKKAKAYGHRDTVLYKSARWRKLRDLYIKRNPLCEKCKAIGITTPAQHIDHIVPVNYTDEQGRNGARWSESNFMALCIQCHTIKTNKEKAGKVVQTKVNDWGELIPVDRTEAYNL